MGRIIVGLSCWVCLFITFFALGLLRVYTLFLETSGGPLVSNKQTKILGGEVIPRIQKLLKISWTLLLYKSLAVTGHRPFWPSLESALS